MKILLMAMVLAIAPTSLQAACFGSHAFKTCTDENGNSYNIQHYGNTTNMTGYNANTGSTWSQNSNTFGNTTITNGTAADGGAWHMQQQRIGNSSFYSGTDSDGNAFSGSCGAFGCN
ncbi:MULTISPECIES: hypothetical protein [unclassified Mesorhizobium]|uniref:hypothetical protein n=1 Tax=unclassified Mesorhizobium TaxID=325217 RepID=UPI001126F106|nr:MULTISPECIES: hypothetical protein [unclassified Mesorhizobium]TPI56828.1 hypothetical protein FJW11_04155 [Mesorhizobium sp. B3-1-1]TPJ72057.1 hypothetical protein FJ462_00235 [Mesorhizobium sp. B2-6-7]TPJ88625.1 hypothetical protein FJ422_01725 [Mesorhizobium sp. B2-6-3]TPK03706.1 hypothetical protein FJ491_01725 [Mesorhizobium sp. B2-5-10]TPK14071.1 hypothetical protein FJ490_01725 [Mesorhizobium sp. B2-5-11]